MKFIIDCQSPIFCPTRIGWFSLQNTSQNTSGIAADGREDTADLIGEVKRALNVACSQVLYASIPKPIALLSTSIFPSKLRARMVNYKDPATMAQDYGACAIPSGEEPTARFIN